MAKERTRSIRFEPCDFEVHYTHQGFELRVSGWRKGVRHKATLDISFCQCAEIADILWKAVNERQQRINVVKAALRGPVS